MSVEARRVLDPYLTTLEDELASLSPSDRAEIVLEVREHFEEARAELNHPTDSDLRNILERLGPPGEIAAEARLRFGVTRPSDTGKPPPMVAEARSPGLLEIAALILWVIWWPIGLLLTLLSQRWSRRHKAMAVLVQLVALASFAGFFLSPAYFAGGVGGHAVLVVAALLFPPTLAGVLGAAYLVWKLAYPGGYTWNEPWRIAGRAALIVLGAWLLWTVAVGPVLLMVMKARGG